MYISCEKRGRGGSSNTTHRHHHIIIRSNQNKQGVQKAEENRLLDRFYMSGLRKIDIHCITDATKLMNFRSWSVLYSMSCQVSCRVVRCSSASNDEFKIRSVRRNINNSPTLYVCERDVNGQTSCMIVHSTMYLACLTCMSLSIFVLGSLPELSKSHGIHPIMPCYHKRRR